MVDFQRFSRQRFRAGLHCLSHPNSRRLLKTTEESCRTILLIHFQYTESAQQRESHRNGSVTSRREERRRHRRDRTKTDRVMLKNVLKHLISLKLKVAPEMTSSG